MARKTSFHRRPTDAVRAPSAPAFASLRSLSARLLALVVGFVLIGEVLIFTPSLAQFRFDYLMERVATGHLALLPALHDANLDPALEERLLAHAGALSIELYLDGYSSQIVGLGRMPPVAARFDLDEAGPLELIVDAFEALAWRGARLIEVRAASPMEAGAVVEVALAEGPMWREMVDYAWRIALLSAFLSVVVAALLFFALRRVVIEPLQRLNEQMAAFRFRPLDRARDRPASARGDEIGALMREFGDLRRSVRSALEQRGRLAALGLAVNKINHDLRNMLAGAMLISDRLENSNDPEVRKVAPRLIEALERAVRLCGDTLHYASEKEAPSKMSAFSLAELVDRVGESALADREEIEWRNAVDPSAVVVADRDRLFRAVMNVGRNAVQAIEPERTDGRVVVEGGIVDGRVLLSIVDNGPGVPPARRATLFDAFAGSHKPGGSGLGLAIAREVMWSHGGDIRLARTGEDGTAFELWMPAREGALAEAAE